MMNKMKIKVANEIPKGWELVKIEDVFQTIDGDRGKNYPNDQDFLSNGYCLFLDTKNVTKNGFIFKTKKFISKEKDKTLKNGKLVRNDIVMTSRGTIGNISFFDETVPYENVRINSAMLILRSKDENINYKYWLQLLRGKVIEEFIRKAKVGSAQPHITKKSLNQLQVAIPRRIDEQQKIAEILTSIDNVISITKAIIEQAERVKKGLMQQLFTKGIGHTKFKKSEIGEIPNSWVIKRLEEIASVKGRVGWKGYTKNDLRESGPLTLGATQISRNNKLDLSNPVHLSKEKYEESPEIMVKKNDILVVQRGSTIGKVVLIDHEIGEATINPSMVILKEIQIDPSFLFYYLCSSWVQKQIQTDISRTSIPMISQKQIKDIIIPIPTQEEQCEIIKILLNIDQKIEIEAKKLTYLVEIKKGLMQVLLTGKVRVKIDEKEVTTS